MQKSKRAAEQNQVDVALHGSCVDSDLHPYLARLLEETEGRSLGPVAFDPATGHAEAEALGDVQMGYAKFDK